MMVGHRIRVLFFQEKAKMIKKGEHSNPSFKLTNEMLFKRSFEGWQVL